MRPSVVLRTSRLRLRRLQPDDVDWMVHLHADPKVMRQIRPPDDREATERRITELLEEQSRDPRFGVFPAEATRTSEVVGWFVLSPLENGPEIELGYRLFPEHWGRGYATEGARALARHAFETIGLERLVAVTRENNEASIRVLEKIGFVRAGMRHVYGADLVVFEATPDQIHT